MAETNGITLEQARALIDAAIAWAQARGLRMALAVVDAGGHPTAIARMDGATILAAEVVVQKARMAVWLGRPTASAVDIGKEWPHVYLSFVAAAQGAITISIGGYPIVTPDGRVLGGIAAAGGTGQQDASCSLAGLEALGYSTDGTGWPASPDLSAAT